MGAIIHRRKLTGSACEVRAAASAGAAVAGEGVAFAAAGVLAALSITVLTRPMKEITRPLSVTSSASASTVVEGSFTFTGSREDTVPALKSALADLSQTSWLLSVRI